MGRQKPRPSSAQEHPTRAPLIHRSATAGSDLGDGRLSSKADAAQVGGGAQVEGRGEGAVGWVRGTGMRAPQK